MHKSQTTKTVNKLPLRSPGTFLPWILMVTTILLILATALLTMISANLKRSNLYSQQITAVNIAEAGINYYLWHLEHDPNDYWDNCSTNPTDSCRQIGPDGFYGPYTHNGYTDVAKNIAGLFSLSISPPAGNTPLVIKSVGQTSGGTVQKTIIANLAFPSFANAFINALTDEVYVDTKEIVNGPIFVNLPSKGIRNFGIINGDISTTCPTGGTFQTQWTANKVGCSGNICPCISGTGQYNGLKTTGAQPYDPGSINFNDLKASAASLGTYYPSSGKAGYHLILANDSYTLKKVKKNGSTTTDLGQIQSESNYLGPVAYPASGLIYLDDTVWVEGQIKNLELTVVSSSSIFINGNLTYSDKNSNTKLGLVAQNDIPIVSTCPDSLTIDAALLAKTGKSYFSLGGPVKSGTLDIFGAIVHQAGLEYQWTIPTGTVISGFTQAIYHYDSDLLYSPPPSFPKKGQYQILNWHEE